jgi:hypothetical protein
LKRLEKNSHEIDPSKHAPIKIDTPLGPRDLPSYLKKFEWDLSRFPRGQTLNSLIGIIHERLE